MLILALILILAYLVLLVYTMMSISKGDLYALLLYATIFFPIYALFLSFTYDAVESPLLAKVIQYSKEGVIFSALLIWILSQKQLASRRWNISILDSLFIAFLGLTLLFFALGIGDATVVNRAIYVKNILLICVFYFMGRNVKVSLNNGIFSFKLFLSSRFWQRY